MSIHEQPPCKSLVLDAGPLLSLSPIRGLSETYFTVPQVLSELKDKRAREHFERLGLSAGVHIQVRDPDSASLAHVIQIAKKTGDYAVLSRSDLCVIALTYALHVKAKEVSHVSEKTAPESDGDVQPITDGLKRTSLHGESDEPGSVDDDAALATNAPDGGGGFTNEAAHREELDDPYNETNRLPSETNSPHQSEITDPAPLYDDPSDEDDGEGEWVTPSNVALHKFRALELLPDVDGRGKRKSNEVINVGCMTADFAMQNVLLHMGLNLIGVGGDTIEKVKSWVLRCHACFKICKDASKKFCPSCGNATLLRVSVTVSSASGASDTPTMQIHLKKDFQYKIRGTVYPIPSAKPGSAKKGTGEGLILREDQMAYIRAKKRNDGKREREEQKLMKHIFSRGGDGGVNVGGWMDPDWVPSVLSVSTKSRGKDLVTDGDMPVIGYGRRNPNERKRRK